jgi:uncharacterized protein (DUF1501 family)
MSRDPFFYSRRSFLNRGVQLLSAAATLPLFLDRSARALAADFAANQQGSGRPANVLVIVQMAGGNDGLNTVVPVRNDDYYRARPTLAIGRKEALRATDDFGFHPSATGFKKMWDDGHLAVLHSVGYPNQNRSHFRSTDIWQTAEPGRVATSGWLGRYFDACCPGQDPGHDAQPKAADPNAAIALTAEPPTTLMGEKFIPLAFRSPADLTFSAGNGNDRLKTAFEKLNNDVGLRDPITDAAHKAAGSQAIHIPRGSETAVQADDFLQRSALNARVYAGTIKTSVATVNNQVAYPSSPFADELKVVAQMIAAGLPTRVYYVQLVGFDTHSGQKEQHVKLMSDLTTVMTFSEFGRRVQENGNGTDHGEAAPLFVMGSAIKPGFHGAGPELRPGKLNRGDVPFAQDFRSLYATMLGQWLGADDAKVLGQKFQRMDLFRPGSAG